MTTRNKCDTSQATTRLLDKFDASGVLGTPFPVFLYGVVKERVCADAGEVLGHAIPAPENLIAIVAILRACEPTKISGSEIKFLRKSVCLKSKEMAEKLKLSAEQFSRYETNKRPIGEIYEKVLRYFVCLHHLDSAKSIDVDVKSVLNMDIICARDVSKPLEFHLAKVDLDENNSHIKWRTDVAA